MANLQFVVLFNSTTLHRFAGGKLCVFNCTSLFIVSGIGAVVKVVNSHLCGWGPNKSCNFLIVSLSKGLSLCFMCSDQRVKYRMPREFPLTSSLLLDYHVKQYTHTFKKHCRTKSSLWSANVMLTCPLPWQHITSTVRIFGVVLFLQICIRH